MVYLYQMRNAFISRFKYRGNMFWGLIWGLTSLIPQIFLWRALYGDSENVAGATLAQTLSYIVLNSLLSQGIRLGSGRTFEDRMKSGDICLDMLRPCDPRLVISAQAIGHAMVDIVINGLPVFVVAIFLAGGILPAASMMHFILFLLSAALAIVLSVVFQMLIGLVAFWFLNVEWFSWLILFFESLFSGAIVPLWFMPGWVREVSMWLPFQAMRFAPIQVYLGNYTIRDSLISLFIQTFWIILIFIFQSVLWRKGIKRIVVLGG